MVPICGISGFSVSTTDNIDAHALSTALLLGIESRGRDATGAAWFDGNGTLWTQKDHMKASDWVPFSAVPAEARTVILHTRFATQGSHWNNDNNHPIIVRREDGSGVVGVHNGMVWNDDRLYTRMDIEKLRTAEVDSEAIFAAIAYGCEKVDGKPRLAKTLEGVLEEIGGSAAIGWLDLGGDPHTLHVARISTSPLHYGFTKEGSFVFASEKNVLEAAARKCNMKLEDLAFAPEGLYMRVRAGSIVDRRIYTPWENQHAAYAYSATAHFANRTVAPTATRLIDEADCPSWDELGENDEFSRVEGNLHKTYKYHNGEWTLAYVARVGSQELATIEDNVVDLADRRETPQDDVIDADVVQDDNYPFVGGVDPDVPDEERTPQDDHTFRPFLSGGSLYAHIAHLMFTDVTYLDDAENAVEYFDRDHSIERLIRGMTDESAQDIGRELYNAGAYLRQGDLVVTDLGHQHNLAGTIIGLPPQFPEGEYLIKLMVPNMRYHGDFEPVIVSRRLDEFMLDTPRDEENDLTGSAV